MVLALAMPIAARAQPAPVATIETGQLRGAEADGIAIFRGIPYAAPPVGDLRWRAPATGGAHGAGRARRQPVQHRLPAEPDGRDVASRGSRPMSEDCLQLNVYAPKAAKGARR